MKIERNGQENFPLTKDDLEGCGNVYVASNGVYFITTDEDSIVDLDDGTVWSLGGDDESYAAGHRYREVNAKVVIES